MGRHRGSRGRESGSVGVAAGPAFALGLVLTSCNPGSPSVSLQGAGIVNGTNEAGFPAVGALVVELPGEDPGRSFCTGTLIAPRWVLTAAHCVDDLSGRVPDRVPPSPTDYLHFFVGEDTRDGGGDGRTFAARRVILRAGYTSPGGDGPNDLALIELAEEVEGVTPIPVHRDRLDAQRGATIAYVGFGANRSNGGGSGRKRSTTLRIEAVLPSVYVTEQQSGGVCFGDSGGPGLLDVGGGRLEVIGVNSTVFGNPRCEEYSTQIRIDAHQTWIDQQMGAGGTGCLANADLCQCPQACGADGICDNAQCGLPACTDISFCLRFCSDSLCAFSCLLNATPEARYLYESLSGCISRECPNRDGPCVSDRCRRELEGCNSGLAAVTGTQACAGVYRCQEGCSDRDCVDGCFYEGSLPGQALLDRVDDCVEAACEGLTGDALRVCAAEACRDRLLACLPDEGCRLTGGDCGPEGACRPEPWIARYCLPSAGVAIGEPCAPGGPAECVDGALCVAGSCREVCADATDCEQSFGPCVPARAEQLPFSVGVCSLSCPDADGDGACDDVDCDPWDPARSPGLPELCDPAGRDEDCDGQRNEDCDLEPPDAGMTTDAGAPADAGAPFDSGFVPPPAAPRPAEGGEGCRCAAPRAPSGPSAALVAWGLLGLALGAVRRRGRR